MNETATTGDAAAAATSAKAALDAATGDAAATTASAAAGANGNLSKPYYSISEVASITQVKPHVLRYWETQFSMLRPRKNRAGNRMYRPQEVELILYLKELLYARRFTIQGAKRKLLDERRSEEPEAREQTAQDRREAERRRLLGEVRQGLENLLKALKAPLES